MQQRGTETQLLRSIPNCAHQAKQTPTPPYHNADPLVLVGRCMRLHGPQWQMDTGCINLLGLSVAQQCYEYSFSFFP